MVGAGPWVSRFWKMLELPKAVSIKGRDGKMHTIFACGLFWCLEEGTLSIDPDLHRTNDGGMPPVIHVDTDAPLYSDIDGSLITDRCGASITSLTSISAAFRVVLSPYKVGAGPRQRTRSIPTVRTRPTSSSATTSFTCGASCWRICQKRFEGKISLYNMTKKNLAASAASRRTNFPVFDVFRENVYVIANSNHGYKMLGVGKLVAQEVMGEKSALLEPFRFARFEKGQLHPTSHSPFPWS